MINYLYNPLAKIAKNHRESRSLTSMPRTSIKKLLERTTHQIIGQAQLEKINYKEQPLRIKFGVDVTAPHLHLGHAVNLWMMRQMQEEGHKVIFLIGDYTTKIGDPTGKSALRKEISQEHIEENAKKYILQVQKVLISDPAVFEVRRNSEWYDKFLLSNFLKLSRLITCSALIGRDMFQERIANQAPIHLHEMLYPILQAYDSVMLNSDLTIVGSDQLFNEQLGRFYQERFGQEPQIIFTSKITPGLCGTKKQSKSLGNYIALDDKPQDKFGKIMSIPDRLIIEYMKVYTTIPLEEIEMIDKKMKSGFLNPMKAKDVLASSVVGRYHGKDIANQESQNFETMFSKRQPLKDLPKIDIEVGSNVLSVLRQCNPDDSNNRLKSLINGGAVTLNGKKILDPYDTINISMADSILTIGKKTWFRINVKSSSTLNIGIHPKPKC